MVPFKGTLKGTWSLWELGSLWGLFRVVQDPKPINPTDLPMAPNEGIYLQSK